MRHLYEISGDYAALLEAIYDNTEDGNGEIPPEQSERLAAIGGELGNKVDACCRVLRDMEATQGACKAEADRLMARARAVGRNCDWLKGYIKQSLESAHIDKLDAGPFRVSIRNSPEAVEVFDMSLVPHEFDVPQERKVALADIKKRLKEGFEIPGAQLTQGTHLRIA